MSSAQSVTATFNPAPANYAGCFTDDISRALPVELSAGGQTVQSCTQMAAAAGYVYAGLQYYGQCFAGNKLGYTQVADAECNTLCNANPSEVCGGAWLNSIYRTGDSPIRPLPIRKSGSGTGTVTSNPAGISCGATCTGNFAAGTVVTLTASPDTGSTFAGWSGTCSGTGSCSVTMNTAPSVTATFNVAPVTPVSSAYWCYSTSYPSYGYQNWLCNAAYHPTYCYTSAWQWTSCPSSGNSATCGNGICEAGENGSNCGQDCCDQTTACGQTKQNQGLYYCRNMYYYDNGSAYWHGFSWVTANETIQMCNEPWEAQEGSYYQTQYQCGGYTGKCHSIPGGYY
jgi:hypothetical protein